uniref:Uncharacterized protein n=1 Tax=Cannabis sativa TaxID=3483 RepID=A0A803Q8M7_CANSA
MSTRTDRWVNVMYSTPSKCRDAKSAANETWPLKTDDYFPLQGFTRTKNMLKLNSHLCVSSTDGGMRLGDIGKNLLIKQQYILRSKEVIFYCQERLSAATRHAESVAVLTHELGKKFLELLNTDISCPGSPICFCFKRVDFPPLRNLAAKINETFGLNFKEMAHCLDLNK